jgi:SAM-dependent methyltransferase
MEKTTRTPPIADQANYWDTWNAAAREGRISDTAARQGAEVEAIVAALGRTDLSIMDVGCGTGWTCERLMKYGAVTGTDFISSVLERARKRLPSVNFVCGDFFALDFPRAAFDVVVCLEVLSHVADQPAFIDKLAGLLKPGGRLILATQNRPILQRWSAVAPPDPNQIRHWVNAKELKALLAPRFRNIDIESMFPVGERGFLRIVNSPKLNAIAGLAVPPGWIERAKERAKLGHTLFAQATKA